jgi:hypothetical protein
MTILKVVGLMVAGWAIGDLITLTAVFLNRGRVRALFNQLVEFKAQQRAQQIVASRDAAQYVDEVGERNECEDCDCDCSF